MSPREYMIHRLPSPRHLAQPTYLGTISGVGTWIPQPRGNFHNTALELRRIPAQVFISLSD